MANDVVEAPNFIFLLYQKSQDTLWGLFLRRWENLIFSLLIAVVISLIFVWGLRKKALIPGSFQNALEFVVEKLQYLIEEVMGPNGTKYLPFLGTLFLYILFMNVWGLIPLMKTPTSSLSITAAFAICVFLYVQYLNIKHRGLLGFLYHLAGDPKKWSEWLIAPIIFPLELLTQFARPITLALRLCGNMLGEHILIAVFALLGIIWLSEASLSLTFPLQLPIVFLALLTGFMQALVFTVLSTVYILLSIPHEKGE